MSILATSRPEAGMPTDMHRCTRCGIDYRDTSARWKPAAPCAGCRPLLEEDGHDLDQWRTDYGREYEARKRARRERVAA